MKRRLPSPPRLVAVGRVAQPRVDMSDGSPEGMAAAAERQRLADRAFMVQVQESVNNLSTNVQSNHGIMGQWKDYLQKLHKEHQDNYSNLARIVGELKQKVQSMEGTVNVQDAHLELRVDASVVEMERVKGIVETTTSDINRTFVTEMEGMKDNFRVEMNAMKAAKPKKAPMKAMKAMKTAKTGTGRAEAGPRVGPGPNHPRALYLLWHAYHHTAKANKLLAEAMENI